MIHNGCIGCWTPVDGIISDRPDLLRDVLVSRGCWAAAGA
jgi:hypothetical protein